MTIPTSARVIWLAGLIDGEGCMYVRFTNQGRYNTPHGSMGSLETRVEIHSVSTRMIDEVQSIYEELVLYYDRQSPKNQPLSTRPAIRIVVRRRGSVVQLLQAIRPFLKVKEREADAIIDFFTLHPRESVGQRSTTEQRQTLVDSVKQLKRIA